MQTRKRRVGKDGRLRDAIKASLSLQLVFRLFFPSLRSVDDSCSRIHSPPFSAALHKEGVLSLPPAPPTSLSMANMGASCSCIIHCCVVSNPLGCQSCNQRAADGCACRVSVPGVSDGGREGGRGGGGRALRLSHG